MAVAQFVREPTSWRGEVARYATAGVLSLAVGAALIHRFATRDQSVEATDTDRAVLVDLPPALASSQATRDAQEGPEQEPAEAAPDAPAPPLPVTELKPVTPPDPVDPPKPERPIEPPKTVEPPMPAEDPIPVEPPKPVEPKPVEPKPVEKPAPPPTAAPSPAVTEQAPAGSPTPVAGEHPDSDDGQPRASAHVISVWQRSLVGRIEVAKHALTGHRTAVGTVQVAFVVDREGHIVKESVVRSSGSPALDDVALRLVRRAAPFPIPPRGASGRDLSLIVPIRFRF